MSNNKIELLKKYDVYGPRYTSYPTALQFDEKFSLDDYLSYVERSNGDPIPKSISLYIHIPFCHSLCFYCGCNKIVTSRYEKAQEYLELLCKEIELQAALFDKDREVTQIHFGGGTPTFLRLNDIRKIITCLNKNFNLAANHKREMGIEIDPRTTSSQDILELIDLGFNRLSFGIQDFDKPVQEAINRLQDKNDTLALIKTAHSQKIQSLSVDLIYGLPKQTLTGFRHTIRTIAAIRPDRIALYNYAHMPHLIKSQKLIDANDLPNSEEKLELFALALEELSSSGYCHIGMDHFALPEDSLYKSFKNEGMHRNFQGYSTHSDCDTLGLGVSAISKIFHAYSQNHKNLSDYRQFIEQEQLPISRGYALTIDDQIRADLIQHIMCGRPIRFEYFEHLYSIYFDRYFLNELNALSTLVQDDLIIFSGDGFSVTPKGRLFLRNIAMIFDVYLNKPKVENKAIQFSKVL
jgi:oxygen-independent coproporphyrinogen-3 oxidase